MTDSEFEALKTARITGQIFGSLAITYILTRISNKIFREKYGHQNAAIISFVLLAVILVTVGYYTMGFLDGFVFYMPGLLFWLLIDLFLPR